MSVNLVIVSMWKILKVREIDKIIEWGVYRDKRIGFRF